MTPKLLQLVDDATRVPVLALRLTHANEAERSSGGGGGVKRSYDVHCAILARKFLADYELSPAEREDETARLAEQIQVAVESHLESLEHRLKS